AIARSETNCSRSSPGHHLGNSLTIPSIGTTTSIAVLSAAGKDVRIFGCFTSGMERDRSDGGELFCQLCQLCKGKVPSAPVGARNQRGPACSRRTNMPASEEET